MRGKGIRKTRRERAQRKPGRGATQRSGETDIGTTRNGQTPTRNRHVETARQDKEKRP